MEKSYHWRKFGCGAIDSIILLSDGDVPLWVQRLSIFQDGAHSRVPIGFPVHEGAIFCQPCLGEGLIQRGNYVYIYELISALCY